MFIRYSIVVRFVNKNSIFKSISTSSRIFFSSTSYYNASRKSKSTELQRYDLDLLTADNEAKILHIQTQINIQVCKYLSYIV